MNLQGIFEGTFESVWSMNVPDEDYQAYLESHPDFDINDRDDMTEMWDYFKSIGCYDEQETSCDFDTTMTGLEINE